MLVSLVLAACGEQATRKQPAPSPPPPLTLPTSKWAQPAIDLKDAVVIEVARSGRVLLNGRVLLAAGRATTAEEDQDTAARWLADIERSTDDGDKRRITVAGSIEAVLVDRPVVIRADRDVRWQSVLDLIVACGRPGAAFWNLRLATEAPTSRDDGSQWTTLAIPGWADMSSHEPKPENIIGAPPRDMQILDLKVACRKPGADASPDARSQRLRWRIDEFETTSATKAAAHLSTTLHERQQRIEEEVGHPHRLPLLVYVEGTPSALCSDVVETLDLAMHAAAMAEVQIHTMVTQ